MGSKAPNLSLLWPKSYYSLATVTEKIGIGYKSNNIRIAYFAIGLPGESWLMWLEWASLRLDGVANLSTVTKYSGYGGSPFSPPVNSLIVAMH